MWDGSLPSQSSLSVSEWLEPHKHHPRLPQLPSSGPVGEVDKQMDWKAATLTITRHIIEIIIIPNKYSIQPLGTKCMSVFRMVMVYRICVCMYVCMNASPSYSIAEIHSCTTTISHQIHTWMDWVRQMPGMSTSRGPEPGCHLITLKTRHKNSIQDFLVLV